MEHFPSNGRINPEWLLSGEPAEDPWTLVSPDINNENYRDAFIGNGYIGQRIPPEGECGIYTEEQDSFMHGIWGEIGDPKMPTEGLVPLPRWCILQYNNGVNDFSGRVGVSNHYRQTVDMRHGLLTTRLQWQDGARTTDIETTVFLSRVRKNIAVITTRVTPHFNGTVSFLDRVDGTSAGVGRTTAALLEGYISRIDCRLGSRERKVSIAVKIAAPEGAVTTSDIGDNRMDRRLTFTAVSGVSYTVTKVVAIVSDQDHADPGIAALHEVKTAMTDLQGLRAEHEKAWEKLWEHRIDVPNPRLQKIINASLYQLYAQLRHDVNWSIGPVGLSGTNWRGRVFWDADLWVLPGLLLLQPDLAFAIINYRHRTLEGAKKNAAADGQKGACFAWESAETGEERVPVPKIHHQRHVNSDIALSQWWYGRVSGDEEYSGTRGFEIILESATYWASRVVYNKKEDRYEIKGVFCADEYAGIRDNNTSTNFGAVKTLRLAMALCKRYGRTFPKEWITIADKMTLLFDDKNKRYIEYEGYTNETIKQADTALLVYPYEMEMSAEVKQNTVDFYRTRYPEKKIMMSSAFDGIVYAELGQSEKAWSAFLDLLPHFRGPFLLVSESPANECISFVTGLGGMLQLVMNGFAGIRIHEDGLLVDPHLPETLPQMTLRGIHYHGISFDLIIEDWGRAIRTDNFSKKADFRIYDRNGNIFS